MANIDTDLVAGEPVPLLIAALRQVWETSAQRPDGSFTFHALLERELAQPFVRALMRIESELLVQDAAAFRGRAPTLRSADDRSADALTELARRLGETARRS